MTMPSRPMLITPLRSEISSPSAAQRIGTLRPTTATKKSVSNIALDLQGEPSLRPGVDYSGVQPSRERDEDDHQSLGDLDRGGGQPDLGFDLGAALLHRCEQQRGRDAPDRVVAGEQGNGDPEEAIAGGEPVVERAGKGIEDQGAAGKPGKRARGDHRQSAQPSGRNAHPASRALVRAEQADPESNRGSSLYEDD